MNRSTGRLAIALIVLGGLFGIVGRTPQPPITSPRPALEFRDCNLVFVSFDAVQAAHLGCHGYFRDVSPTLDALAASGFHFAQAHSVASWTVPSSMTWFTGVYPSEHRVVNKFAVYDANVKKPANLRELAPGLTTLAEVLKRNGYATGGFTGNAGVSGMFGYEQGFDTYFAEPGAFGNFDLSVPKALEWAKAHRAEKFFLFLHGYDAHGQNTPAGGFDYRYVDREYDKKYTGTEIEHETLREEGIERGRIALRDADVRFWRAVYDEKIARADAKFRDFLQEFAALGLMGRTLFVITSDHGTELHEHARLDHGFTLYEETVHVPLIIRAPGAATGRKIAERIGSIDIMPTVLDLLGATVPESAREQLRGRSLVPLMRGGSESRDLFFETDYRQYTYKRGVLTPAGWKLIVTLETVKRELYDLNADPGETRNLAAENPALADELQRKLFAHFRSIGHDLEARRWLPGFNPVYTFPAKPSKR